MDPHGVEVFDRADDDAVIVLITHHFHFVLFPADQRFINQQFVGRREVQPAGTNFFELFTVVSDTAAGAAHGERRTDDAWVAHVCGHRQRFFHGVRNAGTRGIQTDFLHCHIEATAVFRFINRVSGSADHGDAEFGQHALTFQLQRAVQRRLTAHGRQYRIRTLFFDNFAHDFPVNRLNIGRIGHFRVGHDGGRVGVHQNDTVTFFAQGLTGLSARVVKFASLADNDRASAKNQDAFYVCTFWHGSFLLIISRTGGTAQLMQ